jgi:hypothetical protein
MKGPSARGEPLWISRAFHDGAKPGAAADDRGVFVHGFFRI